MDVNNSCRHVFFGFTKLCGKVGQQEQSWLGGHFVEYCIHCVQLRILITPYFKYADIGRF